MIETPNIDDLLLELVTLIEVPSPDEIKIEETRIVDLNNELKDKRERYKECTQRAQSAGILLDRVNTLLERYPNQLELHVMSVLLEAEKAYNEDQASRAHVEREEKRLRESRSALLLMRMKKALIGGVANKQRSSR